MIKLLIKVINYFLIVVLFSSITSCSDIPYQMLVKGMTTVQIPEMHKKNKVKNSLLQNIVPTNYSYQPIFEDDRPHNIGDVLTILLQEEFHASNSSSSQMTRNGANNIGFSIVPGQLNSIFGMHIDNFKSSVDNSGKNEFSGKGNNSTQNQFHGLITVTVQNILPNGNLKIIGEKQVSINESIEYIRFSGTINPKNILKNNIIFSTQVSDARIEYFTKGSIHDIQKMGWLQKILLKISLI